jgi:hypothetical protein
VSQIQSRIGPIKDAPKHALKASLNALRGRISGLYGREVKPWPDMGCRCKATVNRGLWGVGVVTGYRGICSGDSDARLDSICPAGIKCDICKISKTLILSLYR